MLIAFSVKPSETYDQRYQQRDTSVECFVTYLKQQNFNDEFFNTVRSLYSITEACLRGVDYEKEELFDQAKSNLRYDNNLNCMADKLKDETYKNLLLKMKSVRSIGEGVVKRIEHMWSSKKSPKQRAIERVEKEVYEFFAAAEMNCNLKIGFEELFDSFFEVGYDENNFLPYEDVQDFCIKKELVDQQVIDPVKYNIKMYPKNIRVENIDCVKILEPLKSNMIASLHDFQSESFNKNKNKCAFSVLKNDDEYFNLMLKIELLSKTFLNPEYKLEEKKSFVQKMIEISLKINVDCNVA